MDLDHFGIWRELRGVEFLMLMYVLGPYMSWSMVEMDWKLVNAGARCGCRLASRASGIECLQCLSIASWSSDT